MLYIYKGIVKKVIDGDTLQVEIDLGFKIYLDKSVRIHGIDCAELKAKNEEELLLANRAKNFLTNLINLNGTHVQLEVVHVDKYSRAVAHVKFLSNPDLDIGKILVKEGLARVV